MNNDMRSYVINLLETYQERTRKIALLVDLSVHRLSFAGEGGACLRRFCVWSEFH